MYHVFTNEVGMSYSWEGAKKKKAFKNLAVASAILCKLLNNFYKFYNYFIITYTFVFLNFNKNKKKGFFWIKIYKIILLNVCT